MTSTKFESDFEKWRKAFCNYIIKEESYGGDLFKGLIVFNQKIVIDSGLPSCFATDSITELKNAIIMACFCASRHNKLTDFNNYLYQKNLDCLSEIKNQQKAITKIIKFLKLKAPILNSLENALIIEYQQRGITVANEQEHWGEHFYILNNTLLGYQTALTTLKVNGRYSVGCLEFTSKNKPKKTPETASMLIIQLATYFYGFKDEVPPWIILNQGFSVDLPIDLKNIDPSFFTIIGELVEYSLGIEKFSDPIKDVLRKRIKPGMKLCPWPELKTLK